MKKVTISMERQEWDREPDSAALKDAATLGYPEAEQAYQVLIEKGSILSMVNLGNRYEFRLKEDGGPDLARAEYWYRRSVDAGSAVATLPAGSFYLRREKYTEARQIFEIGAERGYAPAMVRLVALYGKGLGVERDDAKADKILLDAANLGNLWAKLALAERYMMTKGNYLKVAKGLCLACVSAVKIAYETKFRPWSENLKK